MALTQDDINQIENLIYEYLQENKIKVSELPAATTLTGLQILGVSSGGSSVRASMPLLKGLDGKNVELRRNAGNIEWRVTDGVWAVLIPESDLKAKNIELGILDGYIRWRVQDGVWANLVSLAELKGEKGDPFVYSDFTAPQLAALKGEKGDPFVYSDFTAPQLAALKGEKGDPFTYSDFTAPQLAALKGEKGDPNTLTIGTVSTGATAGATITGTSPNQILNLTLPKGEKGDTGASITLAIGTVTTGAAGSSASAQIVADGENKYKLNLTIPRGLDGEGAGDMLSSVYDPTGMEQDIFAYVDDKADTDYVNTELGKKVDKEAGKGLSTNDYTNTEKNKLAGIEAEANKYEHPENHPASIITETTTKRFVTDAEKSSWNAKLDANKMQVVTELPASPATGVFYFVKE